MNLSSRMLDPSELGESDYKILDALSDGRCTPKVIMDETNLSKGTVHSHLNVLMAADYVEKVHDSGLYELIHDPREDS